MKKLLLITGIAISFNAIASIEDTFNNLFEAAKKADNCDFLNDYSDDDLSDVRSEGMKRFFSSDPKEIKEAVDLVNRIADCRFPMKRRYNPAYFIDEKNRSQKDRREFLRSVGLPAAE